MKLLKVDTIHEVQIKFNDYFASMERKTQLVNLREAKGRYLAEDIYADMDSPAFRRSVVDGYAVRGADTFGVSESIPVFLDVIGSVEMGLASSLEIKSGQTAYVPTGGMIPQGADAMVMVEHVDQLGEDTIGVNKPAAPNSNIMNIGDDFQCGVQFFAKGHQIEVKDIGLLAACGKAAVVVYKKPKLSILSTGDELVEPGIKPGLCQIRDINAYAIAAFAEAAGAEVLSLSIISDELESYRQAVAEALEKSDMVVISGGSSAGNKDLTAQVIDSMGEPGVITHGLAIKPGKPTIIGIFTGENETKSIIGLPGHPLSSIIVFDVVVNGFLKKYYLGNEEKPQTITAAMSENVHSGEGRETYQLVCLQRVEDRKGTAEPGWIAQPIRAKSGSISQLVRADGYVVISSDSEGVYAGQIVDVILISK